MFLLIRNVEAANALSAHFQALDLVLVSRNNLIQLKKKLVYCDVLKRWVTAYPWILPRSTLPKSEKAALQCLNAL